jgi:hypothetical protein
VKVYIHGQVVLAVIQRFFLMVSRNRVQREEDYLAVTSSMFLMIVE